MIVDKNNIKILQQRIFTTPMYSFLILFLLLINIIHSQTEPKCKYCRKSIQGSFIRVGDFSFHPKHFLCKVCNKVITGSYQEKNGAYFHQDCFAEKEGLKCNYCNKILDKKYIINEGKRYHEKCFEENILPQCSICSLPIKGDYLIDIYGNQYHEEHKQSLPKCDCCNRLISKLLTRGGIKYSDGRNICNLCASTAVYEQYQFNKVLRDVSSKLIYKGLNLNMKNVKVVGVDKNTLISKFGSNRENMQGFCDSQILTEFINDKLSSRKYSHTIYVLNGMSSLFTQYTVAHELMHSWLTENTKNNHSAKITEGSCNYISFIYLKSLRDEYKGDYLKLLESDPDPVYGEGLKYIRRNFENKSLHELLSFLKRN